MALILFCVSQTSKQGGWCDLGCSFRLLVFWGVRLLGFCDCAKRLLWSHPGGETWGREESFTPVSLHQRRQSTNQPLLCLASYTLLQGAANSNHSQAGDCEVLEGPEQAQSTHAYPSQRLQDLLTQHCPLWVLGDTVRLGDSRHWPADDMPWGYFRST